MIQKLLSMNSILHLLIILYAVLIKIRLQHGMLPTKKDYETKGKKAPSCIVQDDQQRPASHVRSLCKLIMHIIMQNQCKTDLL